MVLKSADAAGDEERPPWQWVGFGTVMIFAAWLPLAYAGAALVAPRDGAGGASLGATITAAALPLVFAAAAGGFLVGRFGEPRRVREPLLAGLLTGLLAVLVTALSGRSRARFAVALATAFGGPSAAAGAVSAAPVQVSSERA